jgi:hypothetical protein
MGLASIRRQTTALARAHCCKGPTIVSSGGFSSTRTYAAMLFKTPGGANPMSVNQFDPVPMEVYSELVKGGEETRSPVNYFKLENGASSKKEKAVLVRRPSQGGR